MAYQLHTVLPNFVLETPLLATGAAKQNTVACHDLIEEGWGVFFSLPEEPTAVCELELRQLLSLSESFKHHGCQLIGLSSPAALQRLSSHALFDDVPARHCGVTFACQVDDQGGDEAVPLSADAMRAVTIVGPSKRVEFIVQYPPFTGRNFSEVLRVLSTLQRSHFEGENIPEDWFCEDEVA